MSIKLPHAVTYFAALLLIRFCLADTILHQPTKKTGADPLFQIRRGNKWGFINRTGKTVVPASFDQEGYFFEGLAKVEKSGAWGYVDETGRLTIDYQFHNVGDFHNGLASVQVGRGWGFIDQAGKLTIEPRYQAVADFRNGLARFEQWDVIECNGGNSFTKDDAPIAAYILHDSWSVVAEGHTSCLPRSARFGFIDTMGRTVIPAKYADASDFAEGLAAVRPSAYPPGLYGYIDQPGGLVIPADFLDAMPFSEGLARVMVKTKSLDGSADGSAARFGFINRNGRFAVQPDFVFADSFSEGLAAARKEEGGWGFLNRAGTFVIPPRYTEVSDFSDDLALACSDTCSYIDKMGKDVISIPGSLWPFSGGLTVAGPSGRRNYYDRLGHVVAPYEVDSQ